MGSLTLYIILPAILISSSLEHIILWNISPRQLLGRASIYCARFPGKSSPLGLSVTYSFSLGFFLTSFSSARVGWEQNLPPFREKSRHRPLFFLYAHTRWSSCSPGCASRSSHRGAASSQAALHLRWRLAAQLSRCPPAWRPDHGRGSPPARPQAPARIFPFLAAPLVPAMAAVPWSEWILSSEASSSSTAHLPARSLLQRLFQLQYAEFLAVCAMELAPTTVSWSSSSRAWCALSLAHVPNAVGSSLSLGVVPSSSSSSTRRSDSRHPLLGHGT
jgi:hypothetical protein